MAAKFRSEGIGLRSSIHGRPAAAFLVFLPGAAGAGIVPPDLGELTELAAFESGSYERLTKPGSTVQRYRLTRQFIDQRRDEKKSRPETGRQIILPGDGR